MSLINVKFIHDETLETMYANIKKCTKQLYLNPLDSSWVDNLVSTPTYVEKKYKIQDFELKIPSDENDKETIKENAIKLYETLKDLPHYILCDERFWLWIMFEKAYQVSLKTMPIKNESASVFKDHWLFKQGKKRGIWFGVLSRDFFRVYYSVDEERKENKYEYTDFCFELFERIRVHMWRSYGSNKDIVLSILKAQKKAMLDTGYEAKYTEIAKEISKHGSIRILDCMTEQELEKYVYDKCIINIQEQIEKENSKKYILAIEKMKSNKKEDIEKAITIFEMLDSYKDSSIKLNDSKELLNECNKKKKFKLFGKKK
ncbi:MAG: DUF6339 family protein [Bacillota bacterium]|nr:DUF6339 family protein [Bacillota bacterium]